jgi:hypothetical protein
MSMAFDDKSKFKFAIRYKSILVGERIKRHLCQFIFKR